MHDSHCHIDLYPDPYEVAISTERQRITTIAVTNLPSAYYAAKPHMRQFRYLRLAVGLHPLLVQNHTAKEKDLFRQAFSETHYVGEVGLDFSKQGTSKEQQVESLKFVLSHLQQEPRFVTIHSRRAESVVLQLLDDYGIQPVIFHWYSGPLKLLHNIIESGHYFSVNAAMIHSKNGQRIVARIPKERLLTESDGPFVKVNNHLIAPRNVMLVSEYLVDHWDSSCDIVIKQLDCNFNDYTNSVGVV